MSTTARAWPIAPMKASSGDLPRGADWVYEPKWDGHRTLVRVRPDGSWDAVSSSGKPRNATWPWLAALADALPAERDGDWILDGEVIAMDDTGRHSFQAVGRPDRAHAVVLFDVLAADGIDLCTRPWDERRRLLTEAVRHDPTIMITPVTDDPEAMITATRDAGFEGVVAKLITSGYRPGARSPSWRKVKHRLEQEVVVGGYLLGEGARAATFGSLLVGVYEGEALRFAGAIGTGFDQRTLATLLDELRRLTIDECPFDPVPPLPRGTFRWVRPELVVQAQFAEWTEGGHLRHPVYLGIRDDKPPRQVLREQR